MTDLIEFSHICKSFGPNVVLDDVTFSIAPGAIHALVGENGAGKSTLINLLAGVLQPDSGELVFDGESVRFRNPARAQAAGIRVVYQEFSLFPDLTVAANVFAGSEARRLGFLRGREMARRSREVLEDRLSASVDIGARVASLSVAHQQLVEIARALAEEARVIVLDEPNSALTEQETERLFATLRALRAEGVTIVLVSHRLDEVFSIADAITVIRDGREVATRPVADTSVREVVALMVGQAIAQHAVAPRGVDSESEALVVENLVVKDSVSDISFSLRRGEVLGFAGLDGSGVRELFLALFGLLPRADGRVLIDGTSASIHNPRDAMKLGLAYVPASRREEGLFFDFDVGENITLLLLRAYSRFGFVGRRPLARKERELMHRLDVRGARPRTAIHRLSGGNQQKVVVAKSLSRDPRVLIMHDPTRGIDVGAKAEIYSIIHELVADGVSVLLTSSEFEEISILADRTVVVYGGRSIGELDGRESSESLAHAASTGLLESK